MAVSSFGLSPVLEVDGPDSVSTEFVGELGNSSTGLESMFDVDGPGLDLVD